MCIDGCASGAPGTRRSHVMQIRVADSGVSSLRQLCRPCICVCAQSMDSDELYPGAALLHAVGDAAQRASRLEARLCCVATKPSNGNVQALYGFKKHCIMQEIGPQKRRFLPKLHTTHFRYICALKLFSAHKKVHPSARRSALQASSPISTMNHRYS
jgi:hypothetical protein